MENPTKKFTPKIRVVFQGSIPVENMAVGEDIYNLFKDLAKSNPGEVTFSGQIIKLLEPCCKERLRP